MNFIVKRSALNGRKAYLKILLIGCLRIGIKLAVMLSSKGGEYGMKMDLNNTKQIRNG